MNNIAKSRLNKLVYRMIMSKKKVVVTPYQSWAGYPNSTVLTATYPYQVICNVTGSGTPIRLLVSTHPLVMTASTEIKYKGTFKEYKPSGESWVLGWEPGDAGTYALYGYLVTFRECNRDVYADTGLTTVAYAKTTP